MLSWPKLFQEPVGFFRTSTTTPTGDRDEAKVRFPRGVIKTVDEYRASFHVTLSHNVRPAAWPGSVPATSIIKLGALHIEVAGTGPAATVQSDGNLL